MVLMENSLKKLVVVVPAYNEEEKIKETIVNLQKIKPELGKKNLELLIYVVDDGFVQ